MKNKWFDMGRKEADEHFELDGLEKEKIQWTKTF